MNSLLPDIFLLAQFAPVPQGQVSTPINMIYWVIIGGSMLAGWLVQKMLNSRFNQFSQVPIPMTGKEAAEKMLHDNNITDVTVQPIQGHLTDNYNPKDKTLNLSEGVYDSNSLAAVAVAAHECGHAVQDARSYPWMTFRSAIVPVVTISSNLVKWVIMLGLALAFGGGTTTVLLIGIILYAATTLFSLVTLPVEFNASFRALHWIEQSSIGGYAGKAGARSALFWAAMTYVVGAFSSMGMLLYYVLIFFGSRRNN